MYNNMKPTHIMYKHIHIHVQTWPNLDRPLNNNSPQSRPPHPVTPISAYKYSRIPTYPSIICIYGTPCICIFACLYIHLASHVTWAACRRYMPWYCELLTSNRVDGGRSRWCDPFYLQTDDLPKSVHVRGIEVNGHLSVINRLSLVIEPPGWVLLFSHRLPPARTVTTATTAPTATTPAHSGSSTTAGRPSRHLQHNCR